MTHQQAKNGTMNHHDDNPRPRRPSLFLHRSKQAKTPRDENISSSPTRLPFPDHCNGHLTNNKDEFLLGTTTHTTITLESSSISSSSSPTELIDARNFSVIPKTSSRTPRASSRTPINDPCVMTGKRNYKDEIIESSRIEAIEDFQFHAKLYSSMISNSKSRGEDDTNDEKTNDESRRHDSFPLLYPTSTDDVVTATTTIDEKGFMRLLQDIGYNQQRIDEKGTDLFNQLIEEIHEAKEHECLNSFYQQQQQQESKQADNHQTMQNEDRSIPPPRDRSNSTSTGVANASRTISIDDLEVLYKYSKPYSYKPKISDSFVSAIDQAFEQQDDISQSHDSYHGGNQKEGYMEISPLSGGTMDSNSSLTSPIHSWARQFSFTAGELEGFLLSESERNRNNIGTSRGSSALPTLLDETTKKSREKRESSSLNFFQSLFFGSKSGNSSSTTTRTNKESNHSKKRRVLKKGGSKMSKNDFLNVVFNGAPNAKSLDRAEYMIPDNFNYTLLDPALASSKEFVSRLEEYSINHEALSHHFLSNIKSMAFGRRKTAEITLLYLTAYSHFTSGFANHVSLLLEKLEEPHHIGILKENLEEENGHYDEETLHEIEKIMSAKDDDGDDDSDTTSLQMMDTNIVGVPHRDLYLNTIDHLEKKLGLSYKHNTKMLDQIVAPLLNTKKDIGESVEALLGTLYFSSELVVPTLYSYFADALRSSMNCTDKELIFFLLHVDMDQDHAEEMKKIVNDYCKTTEQRLIMVQTVEKMLKARVTFYEQVIENFSNEEEIPRLNDDMTTTTSSSSQKNDVDCCFEDVIGGRFGVMECCSDHIAHANVLDIGCGDGYLSRLLLRSGAGKVVGIDERKGKIQSANQSKISREGEFYMSGRVTEAQKLLRQNNVFGNEVMNDSAFYSGFFDVVVCASLFKDVTTHEMKNIMKEVYRLMHPGAIFVFSVPHPFVLTHGAAEQKSSDQSYFSLRDRRINVDLGSNANKSNTLKFSMKFKVVEDYILALKESGFEIMDMREDCGHDSKDLFNVDLNGHPLVMIFKARKPTETMRSSAISAPKSLDILPKMLNWGGSVRKNFHNTVRVAIPEAVMNEVIDASFKCSTMELSVDEIEFGKHVSECDFKHLKEFGEVLRKILLHGVGAVLLHGFDIERFSICDNGSSSKTREEGRENCAKLAYYFICRHIGKVDGSARGALFDVKNKRNTSVSEQKNEEQLVVEDNVLFSEVDTESGWHTDGASKNNVYDVIGLMCIHKAKIGGKLQVTNAADALHSLRQALPKFLLYELLRPIPRDILENKEFKNAAKKSTQLLRSRRVLSERIMQNSYPIFDVDGERMRFRYMRYWINTGHEKAGLKVPALLQIAMDFLDDQLDHWRSFDRQLESGEMIFVNNSILAHNRTPFKDLPDVPKRHQVRAWIQIQKADLK